MPHPLTKQILFRNGSLLLEKYSGEQLILPTATSYLTPDSESFRFTIHGEHYVASEIAENHDPGAHAEGWYQKGESRKRGLTEIELREAFGVLPETEWKAAAKGAELLHWNRATRYCARCGARLKRASEISKTCPDCTKEYFPSPAPCVIVLVTRGEGPDSEALLVHAANFKRPFFGLVAGFVETGETLEESVRREVLEETGLDIDNIRYFGSQSWPFPFQMMVGFTARWKSGEIKFSDGELTAGGFFRRDAVPMIPTPPSIARQMIDCWLEGIIK